MGAQTNFIAQTVALGSFYGVVGLLFVLRRNRKQISSRSPMLVLISQFGNYCEQFCILMNVHSVLMTSGSPQLQMLSIFFHFVYYFPYLLRGYRLYFVFSSETGDEKEAELYFLKHIQRSRQKWLLRVLCCLLFPVVVFCVLMAIFHQIDQANGSQNTPDLEAIVIGLSFVEEMILLSLIYLLRRVDSDFAMTQELGLITVLWYLNVVFSFHTEYSFWMIELLVRNTVIMCISMLWPLLKSYKKPEMKEILTLEALHELPLILQDEMSFDYFEAFLSHLEKDENTDEIRAFGTTILHLYMHILIYKDSPCIDEAKKLITEFEELNRQTEVITVEQFEDLRMSVETEETTSVLLSQMEDALYGLLRGYFFPLFLKSQVFRELCKSVEKMELRASKITNTSLYGKDSF